MPCNIIGVIPDTSKFFGFLYLAALDDATPSIVTYDKRGNLITRQQLTKSCYQGCESDCRSIITIDKNLKIKFRYEEYLFDSDDDVSNCSEFPDYASGYVEYSHIDRNGKVKKDKLDSLKYKELMKNPIVHKKE